MRFELIVAAASAVVVASPAMAGITSSELAGGDAAFLGLTENGSLERAVAEGRIGNAATNGTWEMGLWDFGGSGTVQAQDQLAITNGTALAFELTWDGASTVTYTVGTETIVWNAVPGSFTDIFIRTRSTDTSTVALTNLIINGEALPDRITNGGPAEYLRVENMGMDFPAFTFTGVQTFSWTGTRPNNSALAYQIKLSNVIPGPGAAAVLAPMGLLATRRRRG